MRWVYSADLGGTNLRMAAVREDGEISDVVKRETPIGITLGQLISMATEMIAAVDRCIKFDGTASAIAFATPAPSAGGDTSVLTKLPNLPGLNGADLGNALRSATGLPCNLENDATAAAIGEHLLGAARGVANSITITIGTGIGGGLIINSEPFRGPDGTAGEVGHICIEREGLLCGCGSRGCVEQYASVTAIERMATESGLGSISGKDLFDLAIGGNGSAKMIFDKMGRSLGVAVAALANVLNPELIVLAGGGANGWDAFMPSLIDEARSRSFQQPFELLRFARSELGDTAGILGAAMSAFDAMKEA